MTIEEFDAGADRWLKVAEDEFPYLKDVKLE